ncbi:hypothetical protein ACFQ61_09840 [Streptomyces sp. NPDC056500]|uniref:hypothetical protein n=1 Tax=Streptomyces sp. NPDC056500 TaxID=3345840 RepID=UPI003696459F
MEARINGDVVYERFTSPVRRDVSPVADLPHAFKITLLEPNPTFPGSQHYVDRHVGLTDAEADAAKQEWGDRYVRAAIAAAPDAPHWTLHRFPYPMTPGMTTQGAGGEEVMVLGTLREEWTEDGPSFGLGQEEGYLYDLTVRALTSEEEFELLFHALDRGHLNHLPL